MFFDEAGMMNLRDGARALVAALLCTFTTIAGATPPDPIAGVWRIVAGVAGPWVAAETLPMGALRHLQGHLVTFQPRSVVGGSTLDCGQAVYQHVDLPAQGLFQGALPEPIEVSAAQLGFHRLPVPSVRIICDRGSFDYHFTEEDTLLVALDNVVWRLVFHPRTARVAVEDFLRVHFSGDMAFTPQSVARKGRWLSTSLRRAIQDHFATPSPLDGAPTINGDPFTDTQEYPLGFDVVHVQADRLQAKVRVSFRGIQRMLNYHLVRSVDDGWRIDDVTLRDGVTLRALLWHKTP